MIIVEFEGKERINLVKIHKVWAKFTDCKKQRRCYTNINSSHPVKTLAAIMKG
jgi:hypothetical protein